MESENQSFLRRWWSPILLGAIALVTLGTWQILTEHLANSPIIEPYSEVIRAFELQSPRAKARLEAYYTKHQRRTVAGKHYALLCEEMQRLAVQDGIEVRFEPGDNKTSACPAMPDTLEGLEVVPAQDRP